MKNRSRSAVLLAAFPLILVCVGCADSTSSEAPITDESTVSTEVLPSPSSTVAPSTTTTSTLPPFESNFDFYVDPVSVGFPQVKFIREVLENLERKYPVEPGTVAVLYSSSQSSIDWVRRTSRSINCFSDHDSAYFRDAGAQGRNCGLLMRFDGLPSNCGDSPTCRDIRSIAAHEVFHVFTSQLVGNSWREIPYWLAEGSADYVGFAMTRGTQVGTLSLDEIARSRDAIKGLVADPANITSLREMNKIWSQAPNVQTPHYFYNMAFLAVTLLIETYGEQAVLVDFLEHIRTTGSRSAAFERTFGMSEAEFDAEFQTWITTL